MEISLKALADFASLTKDNKLNIMGIFNEVAPTALPSVLPQMYVVAVYEASSAESGTEREAAIVLTDADGNEIIRMEQELIVPAAIRPGGRIVMNQVIGLAGLKITHTGDFQFSFLIDNDEKGTLGLYVKEIPE